MTKTSPAAQGTVADAQPAFRPHHMTALLRHAFLSGRGLGDDSRLSDEDIAAWCAYDPTILPVYQMWEASVLAPSPEALPASGVEAVGLLRDIVDRAERGLLFPTHPLIDRANSFLAALTSAPAPAICCSYCGDTRTITDRVDGEITCPECGYDSQAPAPSGSGGRVKPLEWRKFDSGGTWATTSFGLAYFAQPDGSWRHRNGEPVKAGLDLDDAKAAAQADFEARILSALASE